MGSPIPGSMRMPDVPDHCTIAMYRRPSETNPGVIIEGVCLPGDPGVTWEGCWCVHGERCPVYLKEASERVTKS